MADPEPIEAIILGDTPFVISDSIARLSAEAAFRAVGFSTQQSDITES